MGGEMTRMTVKLAKRTVKRICQTHGQTNTKRLMMDGRTGFKVVKRPRGVTDP